MTEMSTLPQAVGDTASHASRPLLGCIADDYTGGTDVAAAFRRVGLRTALVFAVPGADLELPPCDAVVVALKSRSIPADEAVQMSCEVQQWFADRGIERLFFKYCSTFDSTPAGNIGVVSDAILDAVGGDLTVVCPTSPEHGRTVYHGHLFVGDVLLSDSPMRHHPITPMTDSNLVRVLQQQTPHPVGLVHLETVRAGADAVRTQLESLKAGGYRHVVVDAVVDADLDVISAAASDLAVVTGAAGLARGIGQQMHDAAGVDDPSGEKLPTGRSLVLAGSCSATTLAQVERAAGQFEHHRIDPLSAASATDLKTAAFRWLDEHAGGQAPLLVYSSAGPEERKLAAHVFGDDTPAVLEDVLSSVAAYAVEHDGVRRVVVAGGETSGSVVDSLGIRSALVAREEDRGVPWIVTTGRRELALLLKSGNFGQPDLLTRAATTNGDL